MEPSIHIVFVCPSGSLKGPKPQTARNPFCPSLSQFISISFICFFGRSLSLTQTWLFYTFILFPKGSFTALHYLAFWGFWFDGFWFKKKKLSDLLLMINYLPWQNQKLKPLLQKKYIIFITKQFLWKTTIRHKLFFTYIKYYFHNDNNSYNIRLKW